MMPLLSLSFRLFGVMLLLLILTLPSAKGQEARSDALPDGLYMVIGDTAEVSPDLPLQWVTYNRMFHEGDISPATRLRLATDDFVPLRLQSDPVAEVQQGEKKRLLLALSPEASEKLKTFTASRVDRTAAIVIDGEVVSAHRIRTALTSGLLQISWCGKYACQVLQARLIRNVED
jgi:hypothetical protein